jgi:neutral ceramidase
MRYLRHRYEAGSTLYGPHTLAAYQQEFAALAEAIATNTPVDPGMPAQNQSYVNFHLQVAAVHFF